MLILETSLLLYRTIQSSEAKTLRVCANAFLDHLTLVTETIEAFGPPLEQWIANWEHLFYHRSVPRPCYQIPVHGFSSQGLSGTSCT